MQNDSHRISTEHWQKTLNLQKGQENLHITEQNKRQKKKKKKKKKERERKEKKKAMSYKDIFSYIVIYVTPR